MDEAKPDSKPAESGPSESGPAEPKSDVRRGLIIVNTGPGKSKTTADLVILAEINYAISYGILDPSKVVESLNGRRIWCM